jgi:pSer/pThr/pTyr-binding forkhead associated (FHA) protein
VEARSAIHLLLLTDGTSSLVTLPHDGALLIGRGAEVDLSSDDASVSRRHARIVVVAGAVEVTDLDSHNGTLVNGEAIRGARALHPGDAIAVGSALLVLRNAPMGAEGIWDMNELDPG